ncbi:MAG: CsbD family protein [Planctomycetota bacterium]|nr:CsbD family protein [Planctomycetota bacterium]
MGGKKDEIKGRIKEAAGALTGNDQLRDEGKADQEVGKVEQVVEQAADAVNKVVKKVTGS